MRIAALALVILGHDGVAEAGWADVAAEEDKRVRAALGALPHVANGSGLVEGVPYRVVHQTMRLMRFHPTKAIEAAASHHPWRRYQGFESVSRRPPRGRARRSDSSLVRLPLSSLMR